MYNSKVKNLELPENLFSNLGEIKSRKIEEKSTSEFDIDEVLEEIEKNIPNYEFLPNVKLTNYTNKKEYRDRIDKMYEDIKGIKPIDSEIDNILYFNNYVEKGIVVKPKVSSLKQFWTEFRLINNEKAETSVNDKPSKLMDSHEKSIDKVDLDNFDKLFEALSLRVSEINQYIDELKEMRIEIDKNSKKLEIDKAKLDTERFEFDTYKEKEEKKINNEKENLKINFNKLQTIINDLDKKLVSIDSENF